MDHVIYTAMGGASQTLDQQAVLSNNLANVSTSGFRAQLMTMRAVPVQGAGVMPTRVSVAASTPGADLAQGSIVATGRALDVAIKGDGWLAVQMPDGAEAYTRRGDLQIDNNGLLVNMGRPVIGEGGPVTVPLGAQVFIGGDGTLSAIGVGEDPDALVQISRLKLVAAGDDALVRGEDGLFHLPPDATGAVGALAQDDNVRVVSGALEGSNVSAIDSMVGMIDNSRRYEMQLKVIESADENAQRANNLLSLR